LKLKDCIKLRKSRDLRFNLLLARWGVNDKINMGVDKVKVESTIYFN